MGCSHSLHLDRKNEILFRVALVGIDNSGKSTILLNLTHDYYGIVSPTLGFASETIKRPGGSLQIYDLGGSEAIRGYWNNYFHELHGLAFVVDSSDVERLDTAKSALHELLSDPLLRGKPLVVFANKQDLPTALDPDELARMLDLDLIQSSPFHVKCSIALVHAGHGVEGRREPDPTIPEGFDWLLERMQNDAFQLNERVVRDTKLWQEEQRKRRDEQRARVELYKAQQAEQIKVEESAEPMKEDHESIAV